MGTSDLSMGQQYEHDGYRSGPLPTKKRQDPKIWITREGQRIPIATMGDNHLINARNMVKRSGAVGLSEFRDLCDAYLGGGGPNGEAARDLFEYERSQFLDNCKVSIHLDELEAEIQRRRL